MTYEKYCEISETEPTEEGKRWYEAGQRDMVQELAAHLFRVSVAEKDEDRLIAMVDTYREE